MQLGLTALTIFDPGYGDRVEQQVQMVVALQQGLLELAGKTVSVEQPATGLLGCQLSPQGRQAARMGGMDSIPPLLVALVLAEAVLEKFGGDSVAETRRNLEGYLAAIPSTLTTAVADGRG